MMSDTDILKKAKEMFCHYDGSYFHMGRDEVLHEYKKYNISKAVEEQWRHEMLDEAIENINSSGNSIVIENNIFKYAQVAGNIPSRENISKLIQCLEKNVNKMDSFTVTRGLEDIVDLLESLVKYFNFKIEKSNFFRFASYKKDFKEIKEYFNINIIHLKKLMQKNLERVIIIADERYQEDGKLPSYIMPEEQIKRMNEDIEEWQDMIRHG